MYSQKIVNRKIERWVAAGKPVPRHHSVAECLQNLKHLEDLVSEDPETGEIVSTRDPSKHPSQTLTREELAWIKNERFLCKIDFRYLIGRYALIKSEEDKVVRMQPWRSQEIFLDIVAETEEMEVALMFIILKARQLGLSRVISLMIMQWIVFYGNVNAFMASSTEDKTRLLFNMLDFVVERLPWWMRPINYPQCKARRAGEFWEFHNKSAITLQHGQQTTGIARGTTPTKAHISELAEFDDPGSLIDSSLLRAMHPSPETLLCLEGTAEGINNWWHRTWLDAKAGWLTRRSRLRPIFLPWFVGGLYPKPVDLIQRPMPANYTSTMQPWVLTHAKMAEEYVRKTDYLTKHLGSNWHMPIEQMWYYECERETAIRKNALGKFLSEMPANDDEAFQSTNISVFDTETIVFYRDNAQLQPLAGCYGLRGPDELLPARFHPQHLSIDYNHPAIPITVRQVTQSDVHFELVPLKFNGWSLEDKTNSQGSIDKIYIWEHPTPGYVYGFGADTADGVGKDRTVLEGLHKGSILGPTKQVLEFASSKMNALDSVPFLLAIGTYYTVPDMYGQIQQPRMAIECRGHGDQAQNIVRMLGYRNFHPWVDKQIDNKQLKLGQYHKLGVFTNSWFRAGMIEMLVKMLRDGDIEICSPMFVTEMQSLSGDEERQDLRAEYGGHDDRIMALGFILTSLYKFDIERFRSARIKAYSGYGPAQSVQPKRVYARWSESWQSRTDTGLYTRDDLYGV